MWCWNVYLARKCYCRLSVFGVFVVWFIIIYTSGWKLQANHESRAWGSEHPEIPASVFHTAPPACCSFWSLFPTQAPFQREQSSCSDVIVRSSNFLGRVKARAKHPNPNVSAQIHRKPELTTGGMHNHNSAVIFGFSPVSIAMETLLILPWMGCSFLTGLLGQISQVLYAKEEMLPPALQNPAVSVSSEVM